MLAYLAAVVLAAVPDCAVDRARMMALPWRDFDQTEPAPRLLFAASYLTRSPFNWFGWNDYVAATIAFVDHDRTALLAARARLAATPRPDSHPWTDPDGSPIPSPMLAPGPQWPENLPVVDALVRCFDRTYEKAHRSEDCFAR